MAWTVALRSAGRHPMSQTPLTPLEPESGVGGLRTASLWAPRWRHSGLFQPDLWAEGYSAIRRHLLCLASSECSPVMFLRRTRSTDKLPYHLRNGPNTLTTDGLCPRLVTSMTLRDAPVNSPGRPGTGPEGARTTSVYKNVPVLSLLIILIWFGIPCQHQSQHRFCRQSALSLCPGY